jgi:hypothetical protein
MIIGKGVSKGLVTPFNHHHHHKMIARTYQEETIHLTFSNPNILNKLSTRFTSIRNGKMGGAEKLKEWCAGKEAELPKPHVLLSPSSPANHDQIIYFNTACEACLS